MSVTTIVYSTLIFVSFASMCNAQDKSGLDKFTVSKFESLFGRAMILDLALTNQQANEIREIRRLALENAGSEKKLDYEVYSNDLSIGLANVLLPFQIDRLKQIVLQHRTSTRTDPLGILHSEFKEILNLSSSQVARLEKLAAQVAEEVAEIHQQLKKDEDMVREQATDEILDQLEYDQRKKFKQMTSAEVSEEKLSELATKSIRRLLNLNVIDQLTLTEEQSTEFSTFAKTDAKSKLSEEELVEKTKNVLLPHQVKIFNEAARSYSLIYRKDLSGVSTPWVVAELKITRSQLQQIRSTNKPFAEKLHELQHDAEVEITEQREKLLASSHDILSEEQRERFIEAKGRPFSRSSRPQTRPRIRSRD